MKAEEMCTDLQGSWYKPRVRMAVCVGWRVHRLLTTAGLCHIMQTVLAV